MQYLQKFISKDAGLPYELGERLSNSDPVFQLYEGRSKNDGSKALIFALDPGQITSGRMSATARSTIGRTAIQKLKTLRHPDILKFLAESESPEGIASVAVEYAVPLDVYIAEHGTLSAQEVQWGLVCIARALGFMHSSKIVHGALCPTAVFVTPGGDWKLGGFYNTTQLANARNLTQGTSVLPQQYVSPELSRGDIAAISNASASATDSWAFGCLIHEVFGGAGRELTDTSKLPRRLIPAYQKLLSSKPSSRVPVGDFPQHPFFKTSNFVALNQFIETAPLKGEFERETFFRNVAGSIPNLPQGFCLHKLLPLLTQTIETKEGAAAIAASSSSSSLSAIKSLAGVASATSVPANRQPPGATVSGSASAATAAAAFGAIEALRTLLGEEGFRTEVTSKYAVRLYGDPGVDRSVRVLMYDSISKYIDGMDANGLNGPVFSAVCGSFGDANSPAVRDAAVKAIPIIAPRLSSRNLNTTLMSHFARLQVDPEPAIRTNTTVCLGKLAAKLNPNVQKKVLVPAFLRAMKDPFPPAKVAGLAALVDTGSCFGMEDLARKILPAVITLVIDPNESVRTHAFKVLDQFRGALDDNHRMLSERAKYGPPGDMHNEDGIGLESKGRPNGVSKTASWSLSSLGDIASALLKKEDTLGAQEMTSTHVDVTRQGAGVGLGSDTYRPVTASTGKPPLPSQPSLNGSAPQNGPQSGMALGGLGNENKFTSDLAVSTSFDGDDFATNGNDDGGDDDPDAWGEMEFNDDEPVKDDLNGKIEESMTEEDLYVSMMGPSKTLKKPAEQGKTKSVNTMKPKKPLRQSSSATPAMGLQLRGPSTRKKKQTKDDDDWESLLGGSETTPSRRKGVSGLGARRR